MPLLGCPLQKPFLSGVYLTFLVVVLSRRQTRLISHHFLDYFFEILLVRSIGPRTEQFEPIGVAFLPDHGAKGMLEL